MINLLQQKGYILCYYKLAFVPWCEIFLRMVTQQYYFLNSFA